MSLYEYLKACASRARAINNENRDRILCDNSSALFVQNRLRDFSSFSSFPVSSYEDYEPFVQKYLAGEEHALTNYPASYNLLSSGSGGKRSRFLLTHEALRRYSSYWYSLPFELAGSKSRHEFHAGAYREPEGPFRDTILSAAFYWTQRKNGVLREENLIGGFPFLFTDDVDNILYAKARLLFASQELTAIIANYLYDLTVLFSYIEEHADLIAADASSGRISVPLPPQMRRIAESLPAVPAGRAESLRQFFQHPDGGLKTVFPELEFITGIGGAAYSRHTRLLSRFTGSVPVYYYTYAASECKMGVPLCFDRAEYLLIPDCAYYEFLTQSGELVNLEELKAGMLVSPVVTTFSGLYRYRIKDMIAVQDFCSEAPVFTVEGRCDEILNAGGEKLSVKVFQDAFDSLGLAPADYAVTLDCTAMPARYLVYTETSDGRSCGEIASMLDHRLRQLHEEYADVCLFGLIGQPEIKKIPPGALKQMRSRFFKGGHNKASVLLRSMEAEYLGRLYS